MKRILVFILLVLLVFSFNLLAQKVDRAGSANQKQKNTVNILNALRPVKKAFRPVGNWFTGLFVSRDKSPLCPANPWIDKITLNRLEISLGCVNYYSPCSDKSALIEVFAEGGSYQNQPFVYKYEVSAGKVVGSGARVAWDLSGVKPGIYTITAFAEYTEYAGSIGITKTETVSIVE